MNVVALPDTAPARLRAEAEQRQASDPAVSAFVAASAGSGKTKLLTDRLLRLMLEGAEPGRIQCLTFTKAAAAEMSLRLQTRLGEWVTLDDADLDGRLRELDVAPDEPTRALARALFARVLDLPGGMRIGTIHAFCQSLLRRFPLEAELSPHFRLVEDADARDVLDEAREAMLAGADPAEDPGRAAALAQLAGLATADGFSGLVARLEHARDRLAALGALPPPALAAAIRRAAGVKAADAGAVIAGAVDWGGEAALRDAVRAVAAKGSPSIREKAQRLLLWLGLGDAERAEHWTEWCREFLLDDGRPRGGGALVNKKLAEAQPELLEAMQAEQDRLLVVEDSLRALHAAEATAALLTLAAPVLRDAAARKERDGLLDYDDLIRRSSALLVDPGAAWVLYKLDGGLDHLLLDEVQDTAPAQWRIARAMTEEFFAGLGAREIDPEAPPRSFFAVGDPKQSIYSFQGADPEEFERSRAALRDRVEAVGRRWRDVTLDVSFRSTAPVLALVDAVFADPDAARGVVTPGGTLRHYPNRAGAAGRVELWPLAPVEDAPDFAPWTVPDRNLGLSSAPQRLAEALAEWIRARTDGTEMLESRGRPLSPGDVLVLVRRRNDFARALVRALKARGVAVAGLDRMVLTEQPAVQDLLALCDALLLPRDDLTLACVLTSPLGGLSDDSLMRLALGREGSLWGALRRRAAEAPDWQAAWDFLSRLRARADFTTPHALLAEALGPMGGRARLFARLGPEAAEPVDELMGAALAYAGAHPPSLQGFLHWLRRSSSELKREPEGAGGSVRVMTVHGAKGLQAPLVILPDTTSLPPDDGPLVWAADPETGLEMPLWAPRAEFQCRRVSEAREAGRARRMEEHNRLLYVALTRAEDRLLVCGWQTRKGVPPDCWYELVRRGFASLGAAERPFESGDWQGALLEHESAQRAGPPSGPVAPRAAEAVLPAWLGRAPDWRPLPPPPEPARPRPLAPSRPEGLEFGPVPGAGSPLAGRTAASDRGQGFRRGALVHELLQHLPELPPSRRAAAARAHAARPGHGLSEAAARDAASAALAVLDHPELAPLFGPGSRAEVPLTGVVGGRVVTGRVDRLAVLPDRVLVADYKTNRAPPEQTPVPYLRQMAAYRAVLRGVFPEREVVCALVWTQTGRVDVLPADALDAHAPGASPTGAGDA